MQIIRPAHNKPAIKVESWGEIMADAKEMRDMVKAGGFEGNYTQAHALSHAQVSDNPKSFFVVSDEWVPVFKSWCIINPVIKKKDKKVQHKEACMSFMFRGEKWVDRFKEITVYYWTPFWGFLIPRYRKFKDLPAFIIQHELEHSNGTNIYGLK